MNNDGVNKYWTFVGCIIVKNPLFLILKSSLRNFSINFLAYPGRTAGLLER